MRLSLSCQRIGSTVFVLQQRRCNCRFATTSLLRRIMLCSTNKGTDRNTANLALNSELEESNAQSRSDEQRFEAKAKNFSSNAGTSVATQQPNAKQASASRGTPRLNPNLVARVTEEYKIGRQKTALKRSIQKVRAQLIAFILRDDYQGALALSARFASDPDKANDPEIFSATLLMMARGVRAAAAVNGSLDELEAVNLLDAVIDLCRLLTELSVVDRNSTAAMLALLDAVHSLNAGRGGQTTLAEQERQLEAAVRTMLVHRPLTGNAPRTFMNMEERSAVDRSLMRLSDTMRTWPSDPVLNLRYEKMVPLLEELHENASVAEYLGSPHQYPGCDQATMLALMKEQLDSEMKHCLRVKNIWRRDTTGQSAEEIIDEYDWPTSFAREIVREQQNMTDPFLASFVSAISVDDLVHAVMGTAYYVCQIGLGTIPIAVIRRKASDHVMRMVRCSLHRKFGFDKDQALEKMLAEYSRIFTEDDLPRRYSHREWWLTCAAEMGVDPMLQCPLMSLDLHNLLCERVGRFVIDVMLRGAKFPIKHQTFPAFYECNIDYVRVGVYSELSKTDKKDVKNDPSQRSGSLMVRMVGVDQRLSAKLKNKFDYIDFNAIELPMVSPPRPWLDNLVSGGFISQNTQGLRYGPHNERLVDYEEEVRRRCRTRSQLRPVVDAVNVLSATAWRINKPVLDVNIEVFKMGADPANFDLLLKLAIPMTPDTVQLPETPTMLSYGHFEPLSIEEKFEFVNAKHELYRKKKERRETASIWHTHLSRISIANEFRDRTMFSPCYLDFRGRAYAMSPYFNHLSFDSTRSCFLFAKGKPLGDDGLDWLKVHCINLTGLKKRASNSERLAYADEVLDLILDSADRPMDGKRWWMDADKPWGALAACIEIRDAIRSGDPARFVSHLPVHQDGSCNGLQHYAALGRDLIGAMEVNLTPADRPQDLYAGVAERVEEKRIRDETNMEDDALRNKALELRQLMPGPIARKTVKQTVMTTVYGVTSYGAMLQVKRQLKLIGFSDKQARVCAGYIAKHTLNSLDEAFVSSMQLKRWLRETAAMVTGRNCLRTIEWMTPLALPVIQPYLAPSHSGGLTFLKPMTMKQINSFPPNYIHSLDATHLFLTALHLHRLGGTIGSVHDCYWTHACDVPLMNKICRQQFVNLHQIPLVELIGAQMSKTYLTDALRQDIGQEKYEHLEAQLLPMHKFGELDLESVNDSVYFFS